MLWRCAFIVAALMLGMGLAQGPMSPVQSQISRDWMPLGVERAWAYRFLSLSHSSTPLLAALFTPRIANHFGWRTVCYLYAGLAAAYTMLFAACASDRPIPAVPLKSDDAVAAVPDYSESDGAQNIANKQTMAAQGEQRKQIDQEQETAAESTGKTTGKAFDWRIMRTKPALALMAFHVAADFGEFTRHQLAPFMYMERFGCTPVQMGSYLAVGNAMHIPAGFVWAGLESWLIKRGTPTLVRTNHHHDSDPCNLFVSCSVPLYMRFVCCEALTLWVFHH